MYVNYEDVCDYNSQNYDVENFTQQDYDNGYNNNYHYGIPGCYGNNDCIRGVKQRAYDMGYGKFTSNPVGECYVHESLNSDCERGKQDKTALNNANAALQNAYNDGYNNGGGNDSYCNKYTDTKFKNKCNEGRNQWEYDRENS